MFESEEFELLVALTHPLFEKQQQKIETLVNNKIDWDVFLRLVCWHRVTPQVYRTLNAYHERIPKAVFLQLRQTTLACQQISLKQSAKIVEISKLFAKHNIEFIALKGVALSQLLFQDSGRRESKDIDLLIDINDLIEAESLLTKTLGYIRIQPAPDATADEIDYSNKYTKDRIYQHEYDKTELELHWRFASEKELLAVPFSKLISRALSLQFHKQEIAMLDYEYLWLYQAFHGTYSGWYRLHWVSDIAELLVHHQPDWEKLLEKSERYHCKKCLLEAVVLTGKIYDIPIPEIIKSQMSKTLQQKLSTLFALRALNKAQFINPIINIWRMFLGFPKKYFLLFLLRRVVQTPRGSKSWYKDKPIRALYYSLMRPFSIFIRRLF